MTTEQTEMYFFSVFSGKKIPLFRWADGEVKEIRLWLQLH